MWKHLTHPNIVPLLGVTLAPLQLVSAWMPGGDLKEYITKHPGIDQLNLVGVPLRSCQIALMASSVIRYRRRPRLPPLSQYGPWGSQGGT